MEQSQRVPKYLLFPSFLLIFVVHEAQFGVDMTAFPRFVAKYAKQDSWISVIIAGIVTHLVVFIIIWTLNRYQGRDLFDIHIHLFGKVIGNLLNIVFMIYIFGYGLTYIINFFAFTREYLFPNIPIWLISLFMLILVIYTVYGGLRVVVGVCFLTFLCTSWLGLVLIQIFEYFNILHFLPILEGGINEIGKGAVEMSFSLTGFEMLYFLYPYADEQSKAPRYAQLGILLTNMFYLYLMIVATGFYSEKELEQTIWPVLNLFKITNFPFLEQLEVVVIALSMLVILPNLSMVLWMVSKGARKVTGIRQKTVLLILSGCVFVLTQLFETIPQISSYTEAFNFGGILLSFVYPVILLVFSFMIETVRKKRRDV